MAIVAEFDCANGAHVIVRGDCYRDCSPEEIRRRQQLIKEAVYRVVKNAVLAGKVPGYGPRKGEAKDDGGTEGA